MKPSVAFCSFWISGYLLQIFLLFVQYKFGPRCIVPSCLLPKPFIYYQEISKLKLNEVLSNSLNVKTERRLRDMLGESSVDTWRGGSERASDSEGLNENTVQTYIPYSMSEELDGSETAVSHVSEGTSSFIFMRIIWIFQNSIMFIRIYLNDVILIQTNEQLQQYHFRYFLFILSAL